MPISIETIVIFQSVLGEIQCFLSQIENLDNTIIIRSSTSSEVSAIAVTSDRSNLLIGDMGGNILWTSIWGDEENN